MSPVERHVETRVHGRYLLERPERPTTRLLVGYHGYAERAERQLERLRLVARGDWMVASVEALHLFYRGRTEEVVASWMTRSDRERAIAANVRFVATVLEDIAREHRLGPIVHVGFSQGVGMAFRAALTGGREAAGVVALGGDVPPELKTVGAAAWKPLRVLVARGTRDEWYSQGRMDEDVAMLQTRASLVQPFVFDGGHEWSDAFVSEARRFLQQFPDDRGSADEPGPGRLLTKPAT